MTIDNINRQDLQVMLDNSRIKLKNELQIIINQTRDRLLMQMNTCQQLDKQLMKQCILVTEQTVAHMMALESKTAALDQDIKDLKANLTALLASQRSNAQVIQRQLEAAEAPAAAQTWQYTAST